MKKMAKIFSLGALSLVTCFSSVGCFSSTYTRKGENKIEQTCSNCKAVTDINSLVSNIESVMKKVGVIKGNYKITTDKGIYDISFEIVTKDKRENWDVHAKTIYKDKTIEFYAKNQKFYLIYPNNGANLILKDSVDNLAVEIESTLNGLNVTYDKANLKNMITGDKLEGFNFEAIKENATFVKNSDSSYTIRYPKEALVWEYDITSNFLIKETRCVAENYSSVLTFEYPNSLSISYPMGLDFLTVDINEVKKILEIESFADLID